MLGIFVCWFIVLVSAKDDTRSSSRVVTIESGRVRGYKDTDYDIFVFNGIPYATAPKGLHKFKPPLPAPTWTDIFEATNGNIICPQYPIFKGPLFANLKIQEDCLITNVYIPNTDDNNLPVLVDIHGGSYQVGFGNMLTLKQLVNTKRLIVINFNYRLGVHGFLCLGTKDVPGNAGMKDMVALLRWVKRNIAAFGGNPNKVTISDYSVGASAVNLLLLSPTSKDLFQKAIPESGPNLALYPIQTDPLETAMKYAKAFNFFNGRDIAALENFFKITPLDWLSREELKDELSMHFNPCIERNLGEEPFLVQSPYDTSSMGRGVKVPILYGFSYPKKMQTEDTSEYWKTKLNDNFSHFIPVDLQFKDETQKQAVILTTKEFYFGKDLSSIDDSFLSRFDDFFTDVFFSYSTFRSVRLQVEAGNDQVYLYEYKFVEDDEDVNDLNVNILVQGQGALLYETDNLGVASNKTKSKKFRGVQKLVKELWLNFITQGLPVPLGSPLPAWPPANAEGYPYMSIGESLELTGPKKEQWNRINFWHDIYDRYYGHPVPPRTQNTRDEL